MILFGAMFRCVEPTLAIAAMMGAKSVRTKRSAVKWERAKWERAKWERAKWERAKRCLRPVGSAPP